MLTLHLVSIVEGHGEQSAVPILLRRIVEVVNPQVHAHIQRPFRVNRSSLLKDRLEDAVERAIRGLPRPGAVLVLLDSDRDCPKELAPTLLERAARIAGGRCPVGVVLAKYEFENWFIAAAESVAGHAGLRADLRALPDDPESIRGAKEWLRNRMIRGKTYSETVDQPRLAGTFDLKAARRAPSFDKLYREIERFCALAADTVR
jgi:Domain of unknown function (DUF4276)